LINGRYAEALEVYRKLDNKLPMAVAALYAGDYALAESALGQGSGKTPEFSGALGDLAAARGLLNGAVNHYESSARNHNPLASFRQWWCS
jgi:hypothetical protein